LKKAFSQITRAARMNTCAQTEQNHKPASSKQKG
jgi:hypothetical protein